MAEHRPLHLTRSQAERSQPPRTAHPDKKAAQRERRKPLLRRNDAKPPKLKLRWKTCSVGWLPLKRRLQKNGARPTRRSRHLRNSDKPLKRRLQKNGARPTRRSRHLRNSDRPLKHALRPTSKQQSRCLVGRLPLASCPSSAFAARIFSKSVSRSPSKRYSNRRYCGSTTR